MADLIISTDLYELTKVGLDKIFLNEYSAPAPVGFKYFPEATMDKPIMEEMIMAGFGMVPQWNANGGTMSTDRPISGDRVLFTATDYGMTWYLSHKMLRDDMYQKTGADLTKAAALSAVHTREQDMANVLNLGFTVTGADGKYLFATDHPRLDGGTQSNRPASGAALSATTLQAALVALAKQKNHRGQPIIGFDYALVIPPDLLYTATELVKNQWNPASGYHTENVLKGSVTEIIVNPYLTSALAWFLIAKPNVNKLRFFWREKPKYEVEKDFETKSIKNSLNFAYSVGYLAYDGTYGNPGQ